MDKLETQIHCFCKYNMDISIITASILSLFYVFGHEIGYFRGNLGDEAHISRETKGTPEILERNVRAHGNFIEYVPLFLILPMLSSNAIDDCGYKSSQLFLCRQVQYAVCFAFLHTIHS